MVEQVAYEWQCFPSSGPPESVIAGWRMLLGLPRGAQQNLWYLIRLGLVEAEGADHRQQIEGYAMRFEANPALVLGAVRACQFILRDAAARKLDSTALMTDLRALSGGNSSGVDLLSVHFAEIRDKLCLALLEDTLADHGNVLVGFDWRVDNVSASNHGEMESVPVVFLSLAYRHGDETKKLALQLTPSAIMSLKVFFERFESK